LSRAATLEQSSSSGNSAKTGRSYKRLGRSAHRNEGETPESAARKRC
jgi:hypothetical protein